MLFRARGACKSCCQRKRANNGKIYISSSYLSGLFVHKYISKRLSSDIRTKNDINIL